MRTTAFCEIDPFCRRVLKKHWPDVPCHDDITTREFVEGEADIVCGGFPCQDISDMGQRAGLAGSRSGLYRELLRAIRMVRPKHAIVENVAALLNGGLDVILGDLASIGNDAEWHCIPAGAVGAPHERDRLWIITDAQGQSRLHEPYSGEIASRLRDDENPWRAHPWNEAHARICRVEDGVSDRVLRTEHLGNSVVPQIPEIIGHALMKPSRVPEDCTAASTSKDLS